MEPPSNPIEEPLMPYPTPDSAIAAYFSLVRPHPHRLRITAGLIIPARIARNGTARDVIGADMVRMLRLADLLEQIYGIGWAAAAARFGLLKPIAIDTGEEQWRTYVRTPGYVVFTSAHWPVNFGVELRTFQIFEAGPGHTDEAPKCGAHLGTLVAVHHLGKIWEVVDVEVKPEARRRGVATALYQAVETFTESPLQSPSGWLTYEGLAFWRKRDPKLAATFVGHNDVDGIFLSPKQRIVVAKARNWRTYDAKLRAIRALEMAGPPERLN